MDILRHMASIVKSPPADETAEFTVDKPSPHSLCENENPSPSESLAQQQQFESEDTKSAAAVAMTLGQTLKDELKKSSIRVTNNTTNCHQQQQHSRSSSDEAASESSSFSNNSQQPSESLVSADSPSLTTGKRRPRRNPVWLYFVVDGGNARCKHCTYSTKSVFSTNLKVHLKSHHRRFYEKVLEAEDVMANASEKAANAAQALQQANLCLQTRSSQTPAKKEAPSETVVLHSNAPHSSAETSKQSMIFPSTDSLLADEAAFAAPSNFASLFAGNNFSPELLQLLAMSNSRPEIAFQGEPSFVAESANDGAEVENNASNFLPANLDIDFPGQGQDSAEFANRQKRKRLRRHPVWTYFGDVEDKLVGCVLCKFRTGSAFSTNLKMHLRAHHKPEYLQVMEMELQMRVAEAHSFSGGVEDANSGMAEELTVKGTRKRRRKTTDELRTLISNCKRSLEKDSGRRTTAAAVHANGTASTNGAKTTNGVGVRESPLAATVHRQAQGQQQQQLFLEQLLQQQHQQQLQHFTLQQQLHQQQKSSEFEALMASAMPNSAATNHSATNDATIIANAISQQMSAAEQLQTMLGLFCAGREADNPSPSSHQPSTVARDQRQRDNKGHRVTDPQRQTAGRSATTAPARNAIGVPSLHNAPDASELRDLIGQLREIPEVPENAAMLATLRKQTRDFALCTLLQEVGDSRAFRTPAFELFIYSLADDYKPMSGEQMDAVISGNCADQ